MQKIVEFLFKYEWSFELGLAVSNYFEQDFVQRKINILPIA